MERLFFTVGSISGGLAVALGAFAAHALKQHLAPDAMTVFETGNRYHMVHALALLATAFAAMRWPGAAVNTAGWAFSIGTLLFSGSLYALALSGWRALGAITPLGGVAFLVGWGCLAWAASR